MSEDMVYDACLEVRPNGSCVAQLIEMPACFAHAEDEARALAALEASIPAYFEWLALHDDYAPVVQGPFRVVAAETVTVADPTIGAFFPSDAEPLSAEDLDWYAALLDWSYADLLDALDAFPREAWETPLPGGSSPLDLAMHATNGQFWLTSRLKPELVIQVALSVGVPPGRHVQDVRASTLKQVRTATEAERAQIRETDAERWSLRKVLRRSIRLVREDAQSLGGS
jgi:predicted RNase H-like HicB family nuclease